jgi:hypothetical protein
MASMILRFCGSALFLTSIIFTVPLAFDVGGRQCGLAFSLSLATFYFALSTLRLATPDRSTFRRATLNTITGLQVLVIPSLLIWTLNKFSVDGSGSGADSAGWVSRAFSNMSKSAGLGQHDPTFSEWVFGKDGLLESVLIGGWDKLLRYSTPVFQLVEGFCSLLVIQAAGQVTRYLVNNGDGGDSWMIGLIVPSGSIIAGSGYFIYRMTTFPGLDTQDAILIGIAIASAFFLAAWGMGSGRGNVVESSLLFAYVTLCIYQIFTDYQPSHPMPAVAEVASSGEYPPLPPILMASYTTILQALSTLPSTLHSAFGFILAAIQTVTPSVIISLIYRLMVLYAAARIIPAVRESGARALSEDPSFEDSAEGVSTIMGVLAYYAPSILIAVYTSLLMQHFASSSADHPGEWWTSQGGEGGGNISRWANLAGTMALYAVELYLGKGDSDGLTSHWKLD